jgi:hypothetical protein
MIAGGVKCWGFGSYGELGIGTTAGSNTPVDVCATGATPPCTPANNNILAGGAAIALGWLHTCALATGGGVKCWGDNSQGGQLGTPTTETCPIGTLEYACSNTPLDVNGLAQGQINITNLGQYALPKTCFEVRNASQVPYFQVCDNDFLGAPEIDPICLPDGVCSDDDPVLGSIRIPVAPGDYHVVERQAAPRHTDATGKQTCTVPTAIAGGKCSLTFFNQPSTRPWHPWDINNDGVVRVADIVAVVQHYGLDKPLN